MNKAKNQSYLKQLNLDKSSYNAFIHLSRNNSSKKLNSAQISNQNTINRSAPEIDGTFINKNAIMCSSFDNREKRFLWQNIYENKFFNLFYQSNLPQKKKIKKEDNIDPRLSDFLYKKKEKSKKRTNSLPNYSNKMFGKDSQRVINPELSNEFFVKKGKKRVVADKVNKDRFGQRTNSYGKYLPKEIEEINLNNKKQYYGISLIQKTPTIIPIRGKKHLNAKNEFINGQLNLFNENNNNQINPEMKKRKVCYFDVIEGKYNQEIQNRNYYK